MPARPVYAIVRQDGDPDNPLARFRVESAARYYATAVEEQDGDAVVILHRDKDPELDEPSDWTEVYRSPDRAVNKTSDHSAC